VGFETGDWLWIIDGLWEMEGLEVSGEMPEKEVQMQI